nr:methylated-DNA--[protein]-cysteine S-methyltransferase [Bacillus mediterraneensis]
MLEKTPIGKVFLVAEDEQIVAVHIGEENFRKHESPDFAVEDRDDLLLQEGKKQMMEYFEGSRRTFDLLLYFEGTDFQRDVWNALQEIPYGCTKSYQDIAEHTGRPKAVRAVGQANKANKLPIFIPCHRVIGKNHTLTGYAGSRTHIKEKLLNLEGAAYRGEKV